MVGMQQLPDPGGISNHAHAVAIFGLWRSGCAARRRRSRKSRRSISAWPWRRQGDPGVAASMISAPPEQRLGTGGRRPRADDIGGIAVDGDGPAATSSTTTSPRRWQSAERVGISRDLAVENRIGRISHAGRSISGWRDSPPHRANMLKTVSQIRHRGELCSEYQIQGVLDAHSSIIEAR